MKGYLRIPFLLAAAIVIIILSYQLGRMREQSLVKERGLQKGDSNTGGSVPSTVQVTPSITITQDPGSQIEASGSAIQPSSDQLLAEKVYFAPYTFIDGGAQNTPEGSYYLLVGGEKFIPESFLQQNYLLDEFQLGPKAFIIRGFPSDGQFLIKTDGIVSLKPYYDKLLNEFERQADFKTAVLKMDGLAFYWGEVGLEDMVISKPLYMTSRAITIGSTREEVQRAYGKLGEDTEERWYTYKGSVEHSEGSTTTFVFNLDKVIEIHYG